MEKVGSDQALTKAEFHKRLRTWLRASEETVGPDHAYRGTHWIYVCDEARMFVLNADSKRGAVERFLDIVDREGAGLRWELVLSQRGKKSAVTFGPDRCRPRGFYLYAIGASE